MTLAELPVSEFGSVISYFREFGSLGILAFIVWFVFTKGIPMLVAAMHKMAESQQAIAIEVAKLASEVSRIGDKVDSHDTKMSIAHNEEFMSFIKQLRPTAPHIITP